MYLKSYKELIVWQRAVQLAKEIFILTAKFPASELYGITSQMRRAVLAIASNVAEGSGRSSIKEYIHFCHIAYGSALELETQLLISKELNLTSEDDFYMVESLLTEVLKMLNALIMKLKISSRSYNLEPKT